MRTGIKSQTSLNCSHFWPFILELRALEQWKTMISSFSQSPFIGSLSNWQVMRTGIKARTSLNLGQIGLFTLELFALEHGNYFPYTYNGESDVSTFSQLLWIQSSSNLQESSSNLQVTRTGIIFQISLKYSQVWSIILVTCPREVKKKKDIHFQSYLLQTCLQLEQAYNLSGVQISAGLKFSALGRQKISS